MSGTFEGNPYVGPRPFEPGEKLYGREREIAELIDRLSSERIILLHSPSGAGKSSLIQAGLLPRLEGAFDVWGPTRVNLEPPPAAGEVNRYAASANQGFEEGVPERIRRPAEVLAGQSLAEYFAGRPRRKRAPRNVLLVFDQFEEVLTVDPLAVTAKRELFDQLGELLRDPRIWALFALREDYLAPLEGGGLKLATGQDGEARGETAVPYARRVPTQLRNRFRIDLLGLAAAREAMVEPARAGGREFPAAAALVRDLATRQVQLPDGSFRAQTGHYVEPVQLQVVCRRLWDAMPPEDRSIGARDLERFGDVGQALGAYYDDSVAGVAAGERAVREWFDQRLITAGGIRAQVLMETGASGGLANSAIARLRDSHLVRAEQRAGATWFELAHDRLIEPVRASNAAWREANLSEVQRQAALWEQQDRPSGLLMRGRELVEGERWAAASGAVVTEEERQFLDQSREAQDAADRERRKTRWIRGLAVAASIVAALAGWLGWQASREREAAVAARAAAVAAKEKAERQRAEIEELILKANRQSGRIEDLEQILEGPLSEIITPHARAERLEQDRQPITDHAGRQLFAITLWIDLPDVRKTEVEAVEYCFPHGSFRPYTKTGGERDSGFAITYTGWGCLRNVVLTIRPTGRNPPIAFDLCEALRGTDGIDHFPKKGAWAPARDDACPQTRARLRLR